MKARKKVKSSYVKISVFEIVCQAPFLILKKSLITFLMGKTSNPFETGIFKKGFTIYLLTGNLHSSGDQVASKIVSTKYYNYLQIYLGVFVTFGSQK